MDVNVIRAANLLYIDEHRLFELAYWKWHHRRAEPQLIERVFLRYLHRAPIPYWARHYARTVVHAYNAGDLEPAQFGVRPAYERIPLFWALPLRTPLSVAIKVESGILIA